MFLELEGLIKINKKTNSLNGERKIKTFLYFTCVNIKLGARAREEK